MDNNTDLIDEKSIPVVALIGRPNVGKSTLFNTLTRSRQALVANYSGLTRDRKYAVAKITGKSVQGNLLQRNMLLIDTGGIVDTDIAQHEQQNLDSHIIQQSLLAIDEADAVLFIIDSKTDLTRDDYKLADLLRRQSKKVIVIANKIDGRDPNEVMAEYYSLGLGNILPTAASQKRGLSQVQQSLLELFGHDIDETKDVDVESVNDAGTDVESSQDDSIKEGSTGKPKQRLKVAIIGRPNVGKSTLINRIMGEERVIACDLPGTTRDSIYIDFDWKPKSDQQQDETRHYTLIDTAGVRRRKNVNETVEKFSIVQTLQAIEQANVAILLIDAKEGVVDQDLHLMGTIVDSGTALLVAINKWDGMNSEDKQRFHDELERKLHFINFVNIYQISALYGSGVGLLYDAIDMSYRNATLQIRTSELTQVMRDAVDKHQPPLIGGHRVKLRYAHSGGHNPPIIVIHGNQVESLPKHYQRYLEKAFREHFELTGTPIRLSFKNSDNPFKDKKNQLTQRQLNKKRRMMHHVKRKR